MSAGYGLALPSLGACGIDPYTMHQGQQPSTSSLSSAAVSSSSCGSTGSSSSLPALQPCYPPLSALVEAQQPHAGALQGPHYYFGHRHFNYSAPNLVMTNHGHHHHQSGSPTYDLEWTAPSPSHIRTPAAAISTSPAAHSPPLSAAEAATPGSGGATATSPYSSSLGSWDASSASASADSPAVSPALFYHHHPPPDAAMAAAAVAVAAAGQYHHPHYHHYSHHHDDHQFQQQQAMPAQSSLYYDLPAPTANTDYHPQQQLQSASEEQAAHAPSLEAMSRGRRGRKRRCDEAIMALHPSALLAVKEEEAEAESADELYHHHHRRHNQQQDQLQRQLDGSSSELASQRAGSHEWPFVASEESTMPADQLNSGSSEVDDDDDFFSDDDDDEETNDDDNECDSDRDGGEDSDDVVDDDDDDDAYAGTRVAKRSKRSAQQQQQQQQQTTTTMKKRRRRKQVVKVERRVERRVEVTADLNIEAHLSPESDGYRWRKYGRKTVKGSPYPRSYFKCTFPHCPVKKQVEAVIRDGHIVSTSSIYKGKHNHDRPCVTQLTAHDQDSFRNAVLAGFADYDAAHAAHEGTAEGGGGARSSAGNNTPRLVVTTEASVDYLDDGYRWRKYGQKYVKGSGYPRSYYKCTDKQCPVKKQVDALLVGLVVTYEGAHTHAPCLDKSVPRKRRRRNPAAAPAATTTRRSRAGGEATSTPVKFEPASSPEADELPLHPSSSSSPSADHSSPMAKQERRRSSHLASFRHSAHPVTYHPYHHPQQQQQPPPPQYQQPQQYHQSYHHYHHQQQHQHQHESNDHCAPASSGYHGPGFFPLELKKEKVEEEDHHLGGQHYYHHHHHHQQQQPQQYQTRSALGSSEELSSYISGGFEDLHGEMTDFLMWEESGRGPRHGLLPPAPAHTFSHNSNAAGHYPHHHHQQQHCQASSFPPSISSPLSAPSSSSSFSYTTPLDYDYVPTSGSSFSV